LRVSAALGKLPFMDRAVIFGASRGLGAELAKYISSRGETVTGFARKESLLKNLQTELPFFDYHVADFADSFGQEHALRFVLENNDVNKVFCVAGGGPYGFFHERAFKDHEWAWQVTYVFAARLMHGILASKRRPQVILLGSSVAESEADPRAASYCAAKHALRGLFMSLREEQPDFDLRLFSPGYMDTALLPVNAAARKRGVYDPKVVAQELWTWSLTGEIGGHRVYPRHPEGI
jgi:short-subunit dehydrogenase